MSFIGIAINIWRDTLGTGGTGGGGAPAFQPFTMYQIFF